MTIEHEGVCVTATDLLLTLSEVKACIRYVFDHAEEPSRVATIHLMPCYDEHAENCVNIYWTERKPPFLHVNIAEEQS